MNMRDVVINKKAAQGYEIPLGSSILVLVAAARGYVMCGYLDIRTAEKKGDCAAVVRGVKTVDDLLAGKVVEVTAAAAAAGVKIGMSGLKALEKMM